MNAVVKLPSRHMARSLNERRQRSRDPFSKQLNRPNQKDGGKNGSAPSDNNRPPIFVPYFRGQLAKALVKVRWQLGRSLAKGFDVLAQVADFVVVVETPAGWIV